MVDFNGTKYTYLHNLQGDICGMLDSSRNLVVEYKYDAWGKPVSVRTLTTAYDTLASLNPFRYRGYVWDEETQLYYLRSRYYNPEWGRFINADNVICFSNENAFACMALFAYCGNNPLIRKDTDGKWWQFIATAVGGIISGAIEIASQLVDGVSIEEINWKKVGVATVSGAVSAFAASTGIGLFGQIVINAGIGAASYIVDETINDGHVTLRGLIINMIAGGASGAIGGKGVGVNGLRVTWNATNHTIQRELRRRNIEYAAKRIILYEGTKRSIIRSLAFSTVRFIAGNIVAKGGTNWAQDCAY